MLTDEQLKERISRIELATEREKTHRDFGLHMNVGCDTCDSWYVYKDMRAKAKESLETDIKEILHELKVYRKAVDVATKCGKCKERCFSSENHLARVMEDAQNEVNK